MKTNKVKDSEKIKSVNYQLLSPKLAPSPQPMPAKSTMEQPQSVPFYLSSPRFIRKSQTTRT